MFLLNLARKPLYDGLISRRFSMMANVTVDGLKRGLQGYRIVVHTAHNSYARKNPVDGLRAAAALCRWRVIFASTVIRGDNFVLKRILKQLQGGPGIAVGAGVVLFVLGWGVLGLIAVLVGAIWAWRRAGSTASLLEDALAGTSVVLDAQLMSDLRALAPLLSKARMQSGTEQVALQAHEQLAQLVKAFHAFKSVLRQRFAPSEMTHGRYLKAGEQVFLSALDDLNRAGTQLQALATMDLERMRAQKRQLERNKERDETSERELAAVNARYESHEAQMNEVRGWLTSNEEALTQLSAATGTLAQIRTSQGLAQIESNQAMIQLEELSARAKIYSIDS